MAKLLTLYKLSLYLAIGIIVLLLGCILYNQVIANDTLTAISKTLKCDINGKCEFNPN